METNPVARNPVPLPASTGERRAQPQKEVNPRPAETKTPESAKEIEALVDGANHLFQITNTHLHFQMHEGLNTYYVEIRNSDNGEVIREIPAKKFLDMVAKFQELAGLIFDEKI